MREQPGLFDTSIARPKAMPGWKPDELPDLSAFRGLAVGFDDETTGKDKWKDVPVGTALALPDGRDLYIPYGHLGGGNHDKSRVEEWKRRELRDITLVNLNTGFDVEMELNSGINLETQGCKVVDIAHRAALLDEHRFGGFSLDAISKEYLGRPKLDCPVHGKDIHRVHAAEVADYAKVDARNALDVYHVQQPMLADEDLLRVDEVESKLIYVVNEMERNGIPIDVPKLRSWRTQINQEIEQGLLEIHRLTGLRVNPNSPHDVAKLFKYLGLPFIDVQADTLKAIKHPVVQKLLWVKQRLSIKSKYLDKYYNLARDTGIVRYTLHQLRSDDGQGAGEKGTITGRFSSSGGKDGWGINVQQVMKPSKQRKRMGPDYIIRELAIPASGQWVSSDAAQIEFRLFGDYASNPMMIAAYKEDPWTDFYQFVVDMLMEVAGYKISRDDSKVLNLASIYGQGRDKRMAGMGIDEATLNLVDNAYASAFPEAKRLMNRAMNLAEKRGYVKTKLGRRGRFPDKDRYYRAFNKVLQGTAADIMKLKLIQIYENRKRLEVLMRATVHDEFDGDLQNPDKLPEFEAMMNEQMFPEMKIPILWETGVGPNWMAAGD